MILAAAVPAAEIPCVWTGVERIVAVGDVHGDHERFILALQAAGVIDGEQRWIGGRTHMVQIGDVLDRGPDSRKAMDLLMALEEQALEAGGRVHALIGNHEAMVLSGDLRYVHPGEVESHGGPEGMKRAMAPDGRYGSWIRRHNAVIRINDLLFCHGGIAPEHAATPMQELNRAIRQDLKGSEAVGIARSGTGPLWYRGLAQDDEVGLAEHLETVSKTHGINRIVVGHTVAKGGIQTRAGGRIVMIDVGLSACYGGPVAFLLVEKGRCFSVMEGSKEALPAIPGSSHSSEELTRSVDRP